MSFDLQPLRNRSLSAQVLHVLRQGIFNGVFPPGSRIIENQVAKELDVSRGPVREAIIHLEREGLVKQYPNRGARVVALDGRDAWELYTLRGRLEAWALELGWERIRSQHVGRLEEIIGQMRDLGPRDVRDAVDVDLAFHDLIITSSGHDWLIRTYQGLDPMVGALFFTVTVKLGYTTDMMPRLHEPVIGAIKGDQLDEAKEAVLGHWEKTGLRLLNLEPAASND